MWFDVRFEREGCALGHEARVTLCVSLRACSTKHEGGWRECERGTKERPSGMRKGHEYAGTLVLEENGNSREEREQGGLRTGQGSVEQRSGTVVPCTQPNNRDQPSLMCT